MTCEEAEVLIHALIDKGVKGLTVDNNNAGNGSPGLLELIAAGTDIDYDGASAVELIEPGESAGTYREVDFKGGTVVSKEPVKVSLGTTTVDADSLDTLR